MSKKRANPAITASPAQRPTSGTVVFISGELCGALALCDPPRNTAGSAECDPPRNTAGSAKLGGAYRDRTDDPLLAKQVLSQLS
jgi:hypothetical protein